MSKYKSIQFIDIHVMYWWKHFITWHHSYYSKYLAVLGLHRLRRLFSPSS